MTAQTHWLTLNGREPLEVVLRCELERSMSGSRGGDTSRGGVVGRNPNVAKPEIEGGIVLLIGVGRTVEEATPDSASRLGEPPGSLFLSARRRPRRRGGFTDYQFGIDPRYLRHLPSGNLLQE